ncbi:MAG TPA: bifunctional diguanylate cyclase/phosphodiesterase, partial [Nitrolancea sp.]|nr:bifunctional diguanylate cyclase/phosphodiesterase [Nitrolancea sp.]
ARLGGDEFTVLLEGIESTARAVEIAERIGAAIATPLRIAGQPACTTASIGLALSEPGPLGAEEILRHADAALYQAKAQGRARCVIFNPAVNARAREHAELEAALRHAIDADALSLSFQPAVNLRSGRIVSLEAQTGWIHPLLGWQRNPDLLRLAQEHGLGQPLMRSLLRRACRAAGEWLSLGEATPLSVNVPAPLAHQAGFADLVGAILDEQRLEPARLRLDITESATLDERDWVEPALHELARRGVRLAIDDFGIGQSSLASLRHLPVDALIIDQSFVTGLHDVENVAIVRAIVILARTLELQIAAGGIDSAHDLEQARILGCDLGRGDYISPPVAPSEVTGLLRAGAVALPG